MSVMSNEIDRVARTCVVIECNGMDYVVDGVVCGCLRGWGYSIGPLGEWGLCDCMPPADVAASPGERFAASCCIGYFVVTIPRQSSGSGSSGSAATFKF